MATERSGSRIGRSTNRSVILTINTATHPSTSSMRCQAATLVFSDRPPRSRSAAAPLTMTPRTAKASMPLALGVSGWNSRGTASLRTMTDPITRTVVLVHAPSNEKRR